MARQEGKWMALNWADYWQDTGHLSALEHGAYLNLIGAYWVNGGPLLADKERLQRMSKCTTKEWKQCSAIVLDFFDLDGDMYIHRRVDKELADAKQRFSRAQAGGLARGKLKSSTTQGQGTGDKEQNQGKRGQDFIKDLTSSLSGARQGDWGPAEKKAAWQSKVLQWVQANRPNEEYLTFYEALLNAEEWAEKQANAYDRLRKLQERAA